MMSEGRTPGRIYYDPGTGLIDEQGYTKIAKHVREHYKECPSCKKQTGFAVAEHVHVIPGVRLQAAHTVVLVMCNSCFEIRTLGASKLGIDR